MPKVATGHYAQKSRSTAAETIIGFEIDCPGSADRIEWLIIDGSQLHIGAIEMKNAGFQIEVAGSDRFKATDISFLGGNFRWRFVAGVK
ncbi:hypothetical protein [Rhizobium lusitanum]|uniref:hypothetical protein n=1 Tax=Rhizobium lusitanum TaxID=293958 RepID=UPI000DDF74F4|nr:hypothetical protein [Rhizobium lusitanum]NTJ09586.1 hypothetical protein [Rhizobium lusitanum]